MQNRCTDITSDKELSSVQDFLKDIKMLRQMNVQTGKIPQQS